MSWNYQVLWTTISCEVTQFATWIARFCLVALLSSRVLSFTILGRIQFHWCRPTIVWVAIFLFVETKLTLLIFDRRFEEGFCPFFELIVSFFHSSLIQLVVEIDGYFDEIEHVANAFAIAHNFVLEIVLKVSSKHCHKCDIISLDKIDILLKPCYVLCCEDSLS